jgi:hypothetical protein
MCFLALNTIPYLFFDEDKQPFGAYSIWLGVTGAGAGLALLPCLSYQAVYACQKEEKPVRIFDEDKLGDLNSRLNKLDLDFIHHQTTSKELNILYKKTDKALSDTIAGFIQFGKTVKSALPARGFFSQRNRLVLEYLMPDKKILDLVAPETRKFKQNHL